MRGERQEWEHIHQESLRLPSLHFHSRRHKSPPPSSAQSTCDLCNWGRGGAGYSIQKMHQSADSPKPNPVAPGTYPDSLQLEADGLGTKLLIYLFPLLPRPHSNPQSRSSGRVASQPPQPPPAPRRSLALVTGRRLSAPGGRDALPLVARLARPWVPAAGEAGGRWRVTDVLL